MAVLREGVEGDVHPTKPLGGGGGEGGSGLALLCAVFSLVSRPHFSQVVWARDYTMLM